MSPPNVVRATSWIALFVAGCAGSSPSSAPDGAIDDATDGASDGATDGPDGATDGPGDTEPPTLSIERKGARIFGSIFALSRVGRSLFVGTTPSLDPTPGGRVRGGLVRLDLDSGALKVFEAGFPQRDTLDGKGPAPVGAVVGFEGGSVAVLPDALVQIAADDTLREVVVPDETGKPLTLYAAAPDVARKRLWVGTAQGLVALDGGLSPVLRVAPGALGGRNVTSVAVDPASGVVYAVAADDGKPGRLVRRAGDAVSALVPGEAGVPAGSFAEVAFSAKRGKAYATLAAWDATAGGVVAWSGGAVEPLVDEGGLAAAATGKADAFGAYGLVVDDDDDLLVVGGRQRPRPLMPLQGGGLALVSLADGKARLGLSPAKGLPGSHVRALAYDPVGHRTYLGAMEPCSESKLGSRGLVALGWDSGGALHLERPILSGVRAFARAGDATYAVLRDEAPGQACFGATVQGGLVRLHEKGGGEMLDAKPTEPSSYRTFRSGLTNVAVTGARVSLAGPREELFDGPLGGGTLTNLATTYNVSNTPLALVHLGADGLAVGGFATHDPVIPDEAVDDRSPRGLVLLKAGKALHFVRTASAKGDVAGLPSSEIRALLPDGDGVVVACATERSHPSSASDRELGPVFVGASGKRRGGLVRVDATGAVKVLAGADVAPDPFALARGPDGALWVLDLERGLLQQTAAGFVVVAPTPAKAVWHGLWIGPGSDRAVTSSLGVDLTFGGVSRTLTDVGHAHGVLLRGASLLVGTDEGVLRVSRGPKEPEATPPTLVKPPLAP